MPNTKPHTQEINCPNCGASFAIHQMQDEFATCSFCGTLVKLETARKQQAAIKPDEPKVVPPVVVMDAKTAKKTGRMVAFIAFILIFVPILIGVIISVNHSSSKNLPLGYLRVVDKVYPVVLDDNASYFFLPVYNSTTEEHKFILVDGKTSKTRWQTPALSEEYYNAKIVVTDQQIFLADKITLYAFNLTDGTVQWQRTLPYEFGYCQVCMRLFGDTLVGYFKDGSVLALERSDGSQRWVKYLENLYTDLYAETENVVLEEKRNNENSILVLDPATGNVIHEINPTTDVESFVYINSFRPDAGGKTISVFYQHKVYQQIDLASAQTVKEVKFVDPDNLYPFFFNNDMPIFSNDKYMVMGDVQTGKPLVKFDLETGAMTELISSTKYAFKAVMITTDMLVAAATPSFESDQVELVGISLKDDAEQWRIVFKPQDGSLRYQDYHTTNGSLFYIQCLDDPTNTCTWQLIDPDSGAILYEASCPGGTFIDPNWKQDTLYLVSDGRLYVINTLTGEITHSYPPHANE